MKNRNHDQRGSTDSSRLVLKRTALAAAVATALTAFGAPGVVMAQGNNGAAPPLQLEEIVVTAQRRTQNLGDVPISIEAFNQERMNVQGIRNMSDVAKFTPSLTFSQGGGSLRAMNTSIAIRGVSSVVGTPTTGVYINDIPVTIRRLRSSGGFSATSYPHLFDVKRVEVLRGPQGTLFGAGSEGGTVRFITPEPPLDTSSVYLRSGAATTKYGSPSYEFGIAGGTPIIQDKLGFRGSLSFNRQGGYVDHGNYYSGVVDQEDYNWRRGYATRLALKWQPTDSFTFKPSFFHQERTVNGGGGFYLPDNTDGVYTGKYKQASPSAPSGPQLVITPTGPAMLPVKDAQGYKLDPNGNRILAPYYRAHSRFGGRYANFGHFGEGVDDGNYVSAQNTIRHAKQELNLYAMKFKYSLDNMDIIYDIGLYKKQQHGVSDFSALTYGTWTLIFGNHRVIFPQNSALRAPDYSSQDNQSFTQELRVEGSARWADWTVGAFVQQQNISTLSYIYAPNWGLIWKDAQPGPYFTALSPNSFGPLANLYAMGFKYLVSPGANGLPGCSAANPAACNISPFHLATAPYAGYTTQKVSPIALYTAADQDQKSVYGQATFHATDHLDATLGLRYMKMHYHAYLHSSGFVDGPGRHQAHQIDSDFTTPKFTLKWTTDGGKMFYFTAAKGARNGGTNQVAQQPACLKGLKDTWNLDNVPPTYDPDTLWSYELGTKFRALNGNLNVNAAVYQINWNDKIRVVQMAPNSGGACFLSFTTNMGDSIARGVELAVQYRPIDSLMLSATAGYNHSEDNGTIYVPDKNDPTGHHHTTNRYTGKSGPVYITKDGRVLSQRTTASLAAQYSFNAFDNRSYFRADYHYTGEPHKGDSWDKGSVLYAGQYNLFETPAYGTLNLRLGTYINDWNVSLYVNNATNEQPIFKFRQLDGRAWMTGSTLRPRTVGFTAVLRY